MPIDPSIIANSMSNIASNMPDVNALMQQRVQGAENIYKIEAAREAQAAEAEKEAAKQAAEAMLPAVAAAFSDPSDGGLDAATSLLPPEVASAFTPFMQRLKGIPDPKQRMAILRAELAKDDEGRYILGQLEPTANMRLQAETAAGSQELARLRLKLDTQKFALDAEGKGEWTLQEAEDGFFWVNPRTREVVPADVTAGAAVPGAAPGPTPIPAPDAVTPRAPAPGAPEVAAPISTAQPPREFRPKVKAGEATGDKQQARQGVDGTLSRIMDQYKILAEEKAIVSTANTNAENVQARISTKLGTTVGRTVGTKAQTARDTIANLRQALLADIKAATGMSSKAIDSNVELKAFLDSLGDPDQSLETIQNTLAELSIKYGLGTLSTGGAEAPAATTGTSGFKIRGVREQ